jgi:hypothetical protein
MGDPARARQSWGCVHALVQAAAWSLGLWLGSGAGLRLDAPSPPLGFFASWFAVVLASLFVGVRSDQLRRAHSLEDLPTAPWRVRCGLGWLAAAPFIVGAWVVHHPGALYLAVVGWPLLTVTLDRLVGPLWVLARELPVAWRRRGWSGVVVRRVDGGTVITEDEVGAQRVASLEGADPQLGVIFVRWGAATDLTYRADGRTPMTEYEHDGERCARGARIELALWGLASGVSWVGVWLSVSLGAFVASCSG